MTYNPEVLTTKGDIKTYGSSPQRLAVGSDGFVLGVNSNNSSGNGWQESWIRPDIASGRYLSTPGYAAIGTASLTAANIYFTPLYVKKRTTFTDLGFSTVVITAGSYKVGLYASSGSGPTGTPITNSTSTLGPFTTASATAQGFTFGTAIPLDPGWYWVAILPDTTGTVGGVSSNGTQILFGASDMATNAGAKPSFAQAYASGLPDMTGQALTYTNNNGIPTAGLKVQ